MESYEEESGTSYQQGIAPLIPIEVADGERPQRILVIDDDQASLQALSRTFKLRMSDIQVDTSNSAIEALALLHQYEYDTIVSDIKMPEMDGIELLSEVQHSMPEVPVLLITGHGEHELAMRALQGGAYDYSLKPIDRDFFVASVRRALQTRRLLQLVQQKQRALEHYTRTLESQVEQRTSELIQVNNAKDRMLSMVSHELASPLTSIKGMVQLAQRRLKKGAVDKVIRDLETVELSANRLEMLIHDLRDTIHIQTGRFDLHYSRFDLVELCQHALEEFTLGEVPQPNSTKPPEPLMIEADYNRISQVLLNLLSNARKYSHKGAPITLSLRQHGREAGLIVSDHGIGIPREQLPAIYEQFYRIPESQVQEGATVGLGLGLYIARAIVQQHGGRMEVRSQKGEGSTFSVYLPLPSEESQRVNATTSRSRRRTITWKIAA